MIKSISAKFYTYSFIIPLLFISFLVIFTACAKQQSTMPHLDIKEQISNNQPSISFVTTKEQSDKWYKEYFSPILKESKLKTSKARKQEFENFAKLYFAALSSIQPRNKFVDSRMLLQSVSFTLFSQEFLQEYLFIESLAASMDLKLASWQDFNSKINLHENITGALFVLAISQSIQQMQNESYTNLNNIVLADNLLQLSNQYSKKSQTSHTVQNITGIKEYKLPNELESLLFYRILYAQYEEKFMSAFLLDSMAKQFPQAMRQASNKIFGTNFKHNNIPQMQAQFAFPTFERTNPLVLAQCKAGIQNYPYKESCIQYVFIHWIKYLQQILATETSKAIIDNNQNLDISKKYKNNQSRQDKKRKKTMQYAFPLFADSKLCLLILRDKIIHYPHNTAQFCNALASKIIPAIHITQNAKKNR